jgi:hypothetical protein
MSKNGLSQEASIRRGKLETESFLDIERIPQQPEFCFLITLLAMDMRRLVVFIRVEKKPPPVEQHYSRHCVSAWDTTTSETAKHPSREDKKKSTSVDAPLRIDRHSSTERDQLMDYPKTTG